MKKNGLGCSNTQVWTCLDMQLHLGVHGCACVCVCGWVGGCVHLLIHCFPRRPSLHVGCFFGCLLCPMKMSSMSSSCVCLNGKKTYKHFVLPKKRPGGFPSSMVQTTHIGTNKFEAAWGSNFEKHGRDCVLCLWGYAVSDLFYNYCHQKCLNFVTNVTRQHVQCFSTETQVLHMYHVNHKMEKSKKKRIHVTLQNSYLHWFWSKKIFAGFQCQ